MYLPPNVIELLAKRIASNLCNDAIILYRIDRDFGGNTLGATIYVGIIYRYPTLGVFFLFKYYFIRHKTYSPKNVCLYLLKRIMDTCRHFNLPTRQQQTLYKRRTWNKKYTVDDISSISYQILSIFDFVHRYSIQTLNYSSPCNEHIWLRHNPKSMLHIANIIVCSMWDKLNAVLDPHKIYNYIVQSM